MTGSAPHAPKHTPGPWTISGQHPWKVQCETNHSPHKGEIATVGYRPNANLIAEAATLLETLRALIERHDELVIAIHNGDPISCGIDDHDVSAARAAIDKAEGRS